MPSLNKIKRIAAKTLNVSRISHLGLRLQSKFLFPYIRAVNYHGIPASDYSVFREQLGFYSREFVPVDLKTLRDFISTGTWPYRKPGIILSFDDGCSSHFTRAAPALEEFGLIGWFFVPSGRIRESENAEEGSDDPPMTAEQLRVLDANHVVGCHTFSHMRLVANLPTETLLKEIVEARSVLERVLGHSVTVFCWVGGEENTYSEAAAELIKRNYDISFMTNNAPIRPGDNPFQLQRTNVEAENPLSLLRFQISGVMDILYAPKRRRVNALTS